MTEPIYQPRKPAETYEGKLCRTCGSTLRYRSSFECIVCSKASKKHITNHQVEKRITKRTRKNMNLRSTVEHIVCVEMLKQELIKNKFLFQLIAK